MKKILVMFLLLGIVMTACGKDKKKETTTADTVAADATSTAEVVESTDVTIPISTSESVDTSESTEDIETVIPPDVTETVTNVTITEESGVHVDYEIIKLGNEEIDEIISSESEKALRDCIPNLSSVKELGGTAEYDVKLSSIYKGDGIVSAVFTGEYAIYYETSEEGGEVAYSVNIDPVSGKLLETSDIVDYEKMVAAFEEGRFDIKPDFSQYNPDYGIYPHVSLETVNGETKLGLYITESGMETTVYGYYIAIESAADFLKIKLTTEE